MAKNMEISLLFDFYRPLLSSSCQQAVELYYNDDLSLSEIASELNISRQGVRDLVKRSEEQLFRFESQLGLYRRFRQVEDGLEEILKKAEIISENSDNSEIKAAAGEICSLTEGLME